MSIQRFKLAAFSAFAVVLLGVFHQANASVVYSYVGVPQTNNVQPGASVTVNVYLQELLNGSPSFIASDGGLSGFVTVVNRVPGTLPPMPSILSTAAANTADFQVFNNATYNFVSGTGDSGQIQGSVDLAGVATGTAHPGVQVNNGAAGIAKTNAIYLGNFTITAGSAPGTTQFTLGALDPDNGGATTTATNVFDLDVPPANSGAPDGAFTPVGHTLTTFNVTVAPEPASLGLLAVGGLLALRRRRA